MRGGVLLALAFVWGCGDDGERPAEPARAPEPTAAMTTPDIEEPEPVEEPPAQPVDVESMTEDELEAACFEGSVAACDRLGH